MPISPNSRVILLASSLESLDRYWIYISLIFKVSGGIFYLVESVSEYIESCEKTHICTSLVWLIHWVWEGGWWFILNSSMHLSVAHLIYLIVCVHSTISLRMTIWTIIYQAVSVSLYSCNLYFFIKSTL